MRVTWSSGRLGGHDLLDTEPQTVTVEKSSTTPSAQLNRQYRLMLLSPIFIIKTPLVAILLFTQS